MPLLARCPGLISAGSTCDSLCSLIDLAPTFAELAGTRDLDTDGSSLLPLFRGAEEPRRIVTAEVADVNGGNFEWVGRMVRRGPWKLWQHQTIDGVDHPPVLFNLDDDPEEQVDRANDPGCASIVQELSELLHTDWQPQQVTATVQQQLQDWDLLHRWGCSVQPSHPDTYAWPGDETEADLELL